ncbi:PEGA domain-containing protein [Methanolacinia petrolearia]|uniref:PEGA domain-containing protein n=1 Tax=Methanolacinia petrolearia TaxID=54120 RepID=UPI0009FF4424|nr:PEGA domain-containing protein [Methanolacinia petrolearia]
MSAGRIRTLFIFFAAIILAAVLMVSCVSAEDTTKGSLDVSSNPSGADVYLNDEFIGNTPLTVNALYPGIYYVRLEMTGYESWEKIFDIKEGETTYISYNLDASVGEAYSINTEPDGAEIYFDGEFKGYSDKVLNNLPTGQHEITLVLDGYQDYRRIVYIQEGMSQSLTHVFEPMPTTGTVVVESVPSNADVYMNGEYMGRSMLTLEEVEPGTYNITVKKTGYEDWEGVVVVEAGKISDVSAELTAAKAPVTINTVPEGASVLFDGEDLGTTPLEFQAEQGKHELVITKFGYADLTTSINVSYEGDDYVFELVPMIAEAIAEAEAVIAENSEYGPDAAQAAIEKAKEAYNDGDDEGALSWAQIAFRLAGDVDEDGIDNQNDMAPGVNNIIIYISPVFILIALIALIGYDFRRHIINPVLEIEVPPSIDPDDEDTKAKISIDTGGPAKGHVCTIMIDGERVEYISETGKFDISLAGRMPGLHKIEAKLEVARERYGTKVVTASKVFEVGSDIIIAEEMME